MKQKRLTDDILGKDIKVLSYFNAHDGSLQDIIIKPCRNQVDDETGAVLTDIDTIESRQNLAQALILRLLTPKGSLAGLGHAAYGSRLYQLIGRPKNQANRNLCRLFVLEVIAQEPRVEDKAVSFSFDTESEQIDNYVFTCAVAPRTGGEPLSISLEVSL